MSGEGRFLLLQRGALFGAAAAAFAAVAVSEALPPLALAGFGAAWCLGLFVREDASARVAQAVNLATVVLVLWILLPAFAHRETLPVAAAETALVLCGNRLLVRRSAADDGMLHLSCWLILASGAALTGELVYGLCLVAYAALASTSMMLSELRRGIEEESPEQAHALLAAPELVSRRLLGFAASLGVFSAGFGVLVFPLFPRTQLGFLRGLGGGRPTTGVSDRVDLSGQGSISPSSRLVLQAELTGDRQAARYWRVVTLEHYTGRGWTRAESPSEAVRGLARVGHATLSGSFELFLDASRRVPAPEGVLRLWPDPLGIRMRDDATGDLRLGYGAPERLAFHVEAAENVAQPSDREATARALQLPELSPAVMALARRLIPDGATPEEASQRLAKYFASFSYSHVLHESQTPLDDFLARRSGHCELFATAVAVLMRARGIPARYVAGYYASDVAEDPLTLRDWDAHAWAEVLSPGRGFVAVDVTPPDMRGASQNHATLWTRLLDLWDMAQLHWLHGIIDFDSRSQMKSAGSLARWAQRAVDAILHPSAKTVRALLGLLLLACLGLAALRWPRRRPPAVRLEEALFASLARRGVERGPAETYEEALAKVRLQDPARAETAAALLARIGAARFGGRPLAPGEPAALRARIARL